MTDRYKLVHFYEPDVDLWELFDLKTDPLELKSVYGQPEHAEVQKQLHTAARTAPRRAEGPRPGRPRVADPRRETSRPPQKKAAAKAGS